MLKISNLWVRYKGRKEYTLRGINLQLEEGLVVIAGKTGCGKTTLARTIFGLIPHFFPAEVKGEVEVLGVNPIEEGINALAGKVAYLAQNPELFISSLTVEEELFFPLVNIGMDPEEMKKRVRKVAQMFGLGHLMDESTLILSSGQLQLVLIASAVATGAKVLVLDEPLSRLDPLNYLTIISALRKIADDGRLVLVFEHHLEYLLNAADRVVVLEAGKIVGNGKPGEVVGILEDIDIPEVSQIFIELRKLGCDVPIPTNVEEALEVVKNARAKRRMV